MGNSSGAQTSRSKALDATIRQEQYAPRTRQILLLEDLSDTSVVGLPGSGKSSIFKQIKRIKDDGGFTQTELENYRVHVYEDCIEQMRLLVKAASYSRQSFQYDVNIKNAETILQLPIDGSIWSEEIGLMIKSLWEDSGIRDVFAKYAQNYQVSDGAAYFFDSMERILKPEYCPTVDDVLRVRAKRYSIEEMRFKYKSVECQVLDPSGIRSERRKWIHQFDSVDVIIFVVSLSSFDQKYDSDQNELREALCLFDDHVNSRHFTRVPFVLYLNKTDIFREKLATGADLSLVFPNYTGGSNYNSSIEFIKERFRELVPSTKDLLVYEVCAIDFDLKGFEHIFQETLQSVSYNPTGPFSGL